MVGSYSCKLSTALAHGECSVHVNVTDILPGMRGRKLGISSVTSKGDSAAARNSASGGRDWIWISMLLTSCDLVEAT